ncbi:Unknown protein [Striga hermonthica]|uniref:Histone deacetylation protein Rxt3 n=1 Tax=Striga hermonthica TaxID=68872 RepID=A0A9N7NUI9_STRHE|nr:Unknown protein [Striga hermonthica]
MSNTPNRRLPDEGGNGSSSGSHSHPSVIRFPHEDQGTYSAVGGKVVKINHSHPSVIRFPHEDHAPYDVGAEARISKIAQRNESRDVDRRAPLLPMFRISTPNDLHADHASTEKWAEFRDPKDNIKEIKVDNREMKPETREPQQAAKSDKYESRVDENKDSKYERDAYSEPKGIDKVDKDGYSGSISQLNWKDVKEQHRVKQYPDVPGVNADTWPGSRTGLHGPVDAAKESQHVENRDVHEAREAVGENKVDMKGDDKIKDKDRKRKEVKQWDWGERDRERNDRGNNSPPGNCSGENKEAVKEEREPERWGSEKKEPLKEKEKDHVKRELWSGAEKDAAHNEKELANIPGKSVEQESSALEPKKKEHDNWKNVEREARDRKKERDADVEPERPDKRSRYHEKEMDEGGMIAEGGAEREREVFNSAVQQRKRMLRPRSSPQIGNSSRQRAGAHDSEGSHGKGDVSCVNYKIGECMQELVKLWNEYGLQADKTCEPTIEFRIPAEHVTATNRQVRGGQLWGTDIYTVDSDLVAVLMHTGYCRPTASPPPPAIQELRATIRVLPPQDCYNSTLRNNVRSRAWGAAIGCSHRVGCSYRVERCCIVKKGGGVIDLEPCLTHSSTMEPTLAPVAVERTMTTRAAASNALRQQRFVREVTIQFNLCMEPWLKYSISAVADKGLKKSQFTSARLKKGEVLYVETHSRRYELCFNGEKVIKVVPSAHHGHGVETGRSQSYNSHLSNGEKHAVDCDSTVVDVFRWSRCKRNLPQKSMQSIGIPLPLEHVEVVEDNLEWDDISWSQTGVWIAGKEYHLARVHFLSPN